MVLLGFADDVLNLKWKYKLILPAVSCLPLLTVYYAVSSNTLIRLPRIILSNLPWLPEMVSMQGECLDVGVFYYLFMIFLAIFFTNSINILAGINGLEVGQSLIIGVSILFNSLYQLTGLETPYPGHLEHHLFSIYFICPFIGVSFALFQLNRYPSRIFVGDTYCYFAGMVFAVISILGHFSKTCALFFAPQLINFIYSLPQLFKCIDCPRHRLPSLNEETGLLQMSLVSIDSSKLHKSTLKLLYVLNRFGLLYLSESKDLSHLASDGPSVLPTNILYMNNMTLINLVLYWTGPLHEARLTFYLLFFQGCCTLLAFFVRYYLVFVFYPD